jgi:predicted dehydrogenase
LASHILLGGELRTGNRTIQAGWIKINNAFAYRNLEGVTSRGRLAYDTRPPVRQQALQMDDFARCIVEDRPSRVPGEMGLRDMKIIAAIHEAAGSGERVELKERS